MKPWMLVLVAGALLLAGCTSPNESRDSSDSPDDASMGDGNRGEVSGNLTVGPPGNSTTGNRTGNTTAGNMTGSS